MNETREVLRVVDRALTRLRAIERRDYYAMWRAWLRAGTDGQRLDQPATWIYGGLWSAAWFQRRAEELEQQAAEAASRYDARDVCVAVEVANATGGTRWIGLHVLVDEIAETWERAHRSYASGMTIGAQDAQHARDAEERRKRRKDGRRVA